MLEMEECDDCYKLQQKYKLYGPQQLTSELGRCIGCNHLFVDNKCTCGSSQHPFHIELCSGSLNENQDS